MLARKGLSKQRIALYAGIMVVVWGIIGVVVYKNFFSTPGPTAPAGVNLPTDLPTGDGILGARTPTELNRKLLQDPRFINLKIYGEVPVEPRGLGKSNPFERTP
ncbi:MAG: hypothetical protein HY974_03710 [Candidatus Kerfeldbacteria bacterium]|nr:hypothetical protein [Candidatus Kerfeldbacteria bacterium]